MHWATRSVTCVLFIAAICHAAAKIDSARDLERQGKLEAASQLLAGAIAEYRTAGDTGNLAEALGVAADVSLGLGRYQDAIGQAGEVSKLRAGLHQSSRLGDDYNTIGMAYQYLGNYAAALSAYTQALEADRAAGDAEGEVTRLNNAGNVYYFQGRYSDALRFYDQAWERVSGLTGAAWIAAKRKLTLANLAVLFQRLGQEQRALGYYRQLGQAQASAGQDMPAAEKAQLLLNRGVLYRRLGDPVKALELYHAAQKLFRTGQSMDGEIGALRNIGIAEAMDLQDVPGALAAFGQALHLAEQSSNRRGAVQARLYRGELLRQQGKLAQAETDLEWARHVAEQAGLVEEQWKSLHSLGQIADASGRTAEAESDYAAAIAVIESVRGNLKLVALRSDFLADKRDVYDSMIELQLRDANATPAKVFDWMERSRARTLQDRLRSRMTLPQGNMEAIQPLLPPGTELVEFWTGGGQGAAVWMTGTQSGLVRYSDVSDWTVEAGSKSRILRDILPAARFVFVPDGSLSAVPFETLRAGESGRMLVETSEVSYLPSARFFKKKAAAKWLAPWATEILTLADPTVTKDPLDEHWAPLPEAAAEARAIGEILPGVAQTHLGADMQKRYLIALRPGGAPLVHLATHARIDAENPDRSRILFANDYLLQEEVYDLNLRGVDLVTLSACDTAQGSIVRGEGVQAFSQAFLAAGASAVVTTLWRVADGPTADFMKQFYDGLARGQSKGEALRNAKLRFLRSGALSDSRYWAAFVLTGDGATPIPRALPWNLVLLAAGLLLAIATLVGGRVMGSRRQRQKA